MAFEDLEKVLDDPEALRTYVIEDIRKRVENKVRADDLKHFRLLMYGTERSGDKIIPYAL